MNWGKGIIIAMAAFIGFILVLAITLMRHKVDLVNEDYYLQEIHYQDEIDAQELGFELSQAQVQVQPPFLSVHIHDDWNTKQVELHLTRPNDQRLDKSYTIVGTKTFLIPIDDLEAGNYTLRLECTISGKKAVQSTAITI